MKRVSLIWRPAVQLDVESEASPPKSLSRSGAVLARPSIPTFDRRRTEDPPATTDLTRDARYRYATEVCVLAKDECVMNTNDSNVIDTLSRIGLTENEIEAYLELVAVGSTDVPDLASRTDVSQGYMYRLVERLQEFGLIYVDEFTSPQTVRARPPTERWNDLITNLKEVRDQLGELYTANQPSNNNIELLRSREATVDRIEQYIRESESELVAALPIELVEELRDALSEAYYGCTFVALLVSGDPSTVYERDYAGFAQAVRFCERPVPVFLTVDRARGVSTTTDMVRWERNNEHSIAFNNRNIGHIFTSSFFGNYWTLGEEISFAWRARLPEVYDSFLRAVYDATILYRSGQPHRVTAQVVCSSDHTKETFEGQLSGVEQRIIEPHDNMSGIESYLYLDVGDRTVRLGSSTALLTQYQTQRLEFEKIDSVAE